MHGMVFVALDQHMRDLRQEGVRQRCFPPGAYLAIGDYPETDLLKIAEAFIQRPGAVVPESMTEVLRRFGEAVPGLVQRFAPNLMPRVSSFADVLAQVDRATSSDARSLMPTFEVETRDDGLLALHYRGKPGLCRFAEGMLVGFAARVSESIAFRHPSCVQRGDPECLFVARMLRSETTMRMRAAAVETLKGR